MVKREQYDFFKELIREFEPRETGPTEPYPNWGSRLAQYERDNPALVPHATKGRANLLRSYDAMRQNYTDRIETAAANYDKLPFGPLTKAAFRAGMKTAPESYRNKITTSHEKKWAARWIDNVSR